MRHCSSVYASCGSAFIGHPLRLTGGDGNHVEKTWVRWVAVLVALPAFAMLGVWSWWAGIDFSHSGGDPEATRGHLAWLPEEVPATRGRILAVVTSAERTLDGRGRAGFELTELSRAWWVFESAGFEIDLASPAGGSAPRVIDDDLVDADYAFLNDPKMETKMAATLRLDEIDASNCFGVIENWYITKLHAQPISTRTASCTS